MIRKISKLYEVIQKDQASLYYSNLLNNWIDILLCYTLLCPNITISFFELDILFFFNCYIKCVSNKSF